LVTSFRPGSEFTAEAPETGELRAQRKTRRRGESKPESAEGAVGVEKDALCGLEESGLDSGSRSGPRKRRHEWGTVPSRMSLPAETSRIAERRLKPAAARIGCPTNSSELKSEGEKELVMARASSGGE
jgi:hypothetical protein